MQQPAVKPRPKRATQRELVRRDARMFERFAAGATLEEIALRERLTVRRVRERLAEIFATRQEQSPADFAQLQLRRLGEAMLVSWSAMTGGNLDAVDRVVRITREMDRYHGFSIRQLASLRLPPEAQPAALAAPSAPLAVAPLREREEAS